tara:strand:- start:189 stop:824 length:636 start_codon:yes stop_codon:yes gene_type:complete
MNIEIVTNQISNINLDKKIPQYDKKIEEVENNFKKLTIRKRKRVTTSYKRPTKRMKTYPLTNFFPKKQNDSWKYTSNNYEKQETPKDSQLILYEPSILNKIFDYIDSIKAEKKIKLKHIISEPKRIKTEILTKEVEMLPELEKPTESDYDSNDEIYGYDDEEWDTKTQVIPYPDYNCDETEYEYNDINESEEYYVNKYFRSPKSAIVLKYE